MKLSINVHLQFFFGRLSIILIYNNEESKKIQKSIKKMVRKLEKNLILIRHRQWKQVKRGREYATNANNRSVSLNLFLYNNQNPS